MKTRQTLVICFCILFAFSAKSVVSAVFLQELETKVLKLYMSEIKYAYQGNEVLMFEKFPPLCVCKYVRQTWGGGDEYLLEFSRQNVDGSFEILLPPDLNPKGVPPTLWSISAEEHPHMAVITILSKCQGNGGLWVKETYHYDGLSVTKENSVVGIGDPYHKDEQTGEFVPTPPSWWGPPAEWKWERYRKDPETGMVWMLVPNETLENDKSSAEEKALRFRQDPKTGFWWKRVQ